MNLAFKIAIGMRDKLLGVISGLEQSEQELEKSLSRFAGILDLVDDAIISTNQAQLVTMFNQGAERIFGYSANEIIGRPIVLLIPERDRGMNGWPVDGSIARPDESMGMPERNEIVGLRKDGTEI